MSWKRLSGATVLLLLLIMFFSVPGWAQEEPALKAVTTRLLESYLKVGPRKSELPTGSDNANWAILEKVGLTEFLLQPQLNVGVWSTVWSPIKTVLQKKGFAALSPLEAVTWWEETRNEPSRFVRLLAQRGLLDARVPKARAKGESLRSSLGAANGKLQEIRANLRYERAGWTFTGTASLVPGQRVVRAVLRGSQPCSVSGKVKSVDLALKGRLFADKDGPGGFKLQLLEHQFRSTGCEETLNSQITTMMLLTAGGEARVSGNLVMQVRDDTVTGRLQLDLTQRQTGVALQTGHAIYSLRASLGEDGSLTGILNPVSTSGSKIFREPLMKAGALEGQIKLHQGAGQISFPAFKQPLSWRATVE